MAIADADTATAAAAKDPHGGAGRWIALLTVLGIIVISFVAQGIGWGGALFGLSSSSQVPAFAATLIQALLLAGPLALLAFIWPALRYRAMFQTWLAAALVLLALSPVRLLPPVAGQSAYLLQAAILGLILLLLRVLFPIRSVGAQSGIALAVAAGLGLLAGLPWVRIGALGSFLDIAIAAILALLFGLTAGRIVGRFWLHPLETANRTPGRDYFTGGIVIGVAWLIVASGLSLNGVQIALMLALPALGWAAMAVATFGAARPQPTRWLAVAFLVATATWTGIAFVDSDGMAPIIGDAILGDVLKASLIAAAIGWLIALVMWLMLRRTWRVSAVAPLRSGWLIVPALMILVAGLVFATGGQMGTHGDRLFVVLREQADVSGAAQMTDYDARRNYVYDTLVTQAERTQAPLRATLDRLGVSYTPYYLVNALEVSGGLPMRWWLETRGDVARVMPSPSLRPPQAELGVASGSMAKPPEPQWNLTEIGAPRVWDEFGARGQGIVVGQSDSGVQYDHPELLASYRGRDGNHDYDWFDPWYGEPAPVDFGGHGTHTLGSVLGDSVGVAPDATWIACANLPRNLGSAARYLDCLQFMLAPFPLDGDPFRDGDPVLSANVLNNSWGCPQEYEGCDPESLRPAVAALRDAGIFVVASAGNDGPACSTLNDPIALYDEVFTVGAVDEQGNLADFSSRGPTLSEVGGRVKPDIVAPGVAVLSAFPESTYEINSGTSMAGPHVAGVVALLWSANPELIGDIERTEEILIETTRSYSGVPPVTCGETGTTQPNNETGYGMVDAYAATQRAVEWR